MRSSWTRTTVRSDRIEDRVFRYKATYPLPEFTLG